MANPLLLDIVTYLKTKEIVTDDGVDAFRDFTPEAPDTLVTLHEYQGEPAVQFESKVHRSVQISARDKQADLARQKALTIYKALLSDTLIINFTDDRWGQVYLRQPPFKLSEDTNGRVTYAFNIGVTTTNE
jgi:hypothetical protein